MRKFHQIKITMSWLTNGQCIRLRFVNLLIVFVCVFTPPLVTAQDSPGSISPDVSHNSVIRDTPAKVHQVIPGDTLWNLAERYYGDALQWPQIQGINALEDANYLVPGTLIDLTRQDAFPLDVVYLKGDVWQVDESRKQTLGTDATLEPGSRLETGPGAALTLATQDGSQVVVPSNTRVVIKRDRELGIRLDLTKGELDLQVAPRDNKNRPFNIQTDSGVLGVRGTRFIAEVKKEATVSSVYEGSVAAEEKHQRVERARIAAGEGVRAADDGRLDVVDLLKAPQQLKADTRAAGIIVASVKPSQLASGYQATLSKDPNAQQVVAVQRSDTPSLVFNDIPDGRYYLRVAAIDSLGIVGKYSRLTIDHQLEGVSVKQVGDAWRFFIWRYRSDATHDLELALDATFEKRLMTYPRLGSVRVVVNQLPNAPVFWRVVTKDSNGNVTRVIDQGLINARR